MHNLKIKQLTGQMISISLFPFPHFSQSKSDTRQYHVPMPFLHSLTSPEEKGTLLNQILIFIDLYVTLLI